MTGITPFVMLPGAGPSCEGDDCLPVASSAPATLAVTGDTPPTS